MLPLGLYMCLTQQKPLDMGLLHATRLALYGIRGGEGYHLASCGRTWDGAVVRRPLSLASYPNVAHQNAVYDRIQVGLQ